MKKLKSERHHWWPRCISKHWADQEGCVHWLLPDGEVRYAPPQNFGVIGNGHYIKFGKLPGEHSSWDQNYESEFNSADENVPQLIDWLKSLKRKEPDSSSILSSRFCPVAASDEEIERLVACMVSLAIRGPMNRQAAVSLAEHFRGPLPERERNALIGVNMRRDYRTAAESIGTRGKFVAVFSPKREFIYGDGFFHNLRSPAHNPMFLKMLVPITPHISVLFVQPTRYSTEPRLCTLVITAEEAVDLNHAVQVYSKDAIFYRSEKPEALDVFLRGEHLRYTDGNNSVDRLIQEIPGVQTRNPLFGYFG